MNQVSRRIIVLTALGSIFATFCSTTPRQSALAARFKDVEKNIVEMRAVLHRNTVRFAAVIEESADSIKKETRDVQIQRNALLWTMYGIPAVHQAAFHPDPVAGLLDLKTLAIQMYNFFETGHGQHSFGEWQHIALDGLEKYHLALNEAIRAMTISGDITVAQEYVRSWADEYPVEDLYFQRTPFTVLLDSLMYDEKRGLFDATGLIADGMNDLSGRMNIYTEYIPRQARWQVEYLLLMESTKIINMVIDSVQFQLNSILDSINIQRIATLYELQKERIALTDFVRSERVAVFDELHVLRDKSITDIRGVVDNLRGIGIVLIIVLIGVPLTLGVIIGRMIRQKG